MILNKSSNRTFGISHEMGNYCHAPRRLKAWCTQFQAVYKPSQKATYSNNVQLLMRFQQNWMDLLRKFNNKVPAEASYQQLIIPSQLELSQL